MMEVVFPVIRLNKLTCLLSTLYYEFGIQKGAILHVKGEIANTGRY
jgi:hypothetical protein